MQKTVLPGLFMRDYALSGTLRQGIVCLMKNNGFTSFYLLTFLPKHE